MNKAQSIVLLHGLLGDQSFWQPQINSLATAGDIFTPEYSDHTTLPSAAAELLSKLPNRFSIIGFSLGGNLALELYRQAKNRVNSIALISTGTLPLQEEAIIRLKLAYQNIKENESTYDDFIIECANRFFDKEAQLNLWNQFISTGLAQGKEKCLNQLNMLLEGRTSAQRIDCPGLILYGKNDSSVKHWRIQRAIDLFNKKKVIEVAETKHFLSWEKPHLISKHLLNWLISV